MAMFIIKDTEQVREKYDLIVNLLDIQVAQNILKSNGLSRQSSSQSASKKVKTMVVNPLDTSYM